LFWEEENEEKKELSSLRSQLIGMMGLENWGNGEMGY